MIKMIIPVKKTKDKKPYKRGLWLHENKLYYDYLNIITRDTLTKKQLFKTCKKHNQLSIFYIRKNQGFIYNQDTGKIDILPFKTVLIHKGFKGLKHRLKDILNRFKGLTIDIKGNDYIITVYHV